jgi:protoporphyrinogen oxidase
MLNLSTSWQSLEPSTAHTWLKTAYGEKIYSLIWQPMLEGKFGPYYKKVTMAWMWARLKARTSKLATFKGGFQAFTDRFSQELTSWSRHPSLNTSDKTN